MQLQLVSLVKVLWLFQKRISKAFYAERGLTFKLNSLIFYMTIKLVFPEGLQNFISDFFKGDTR